MLLSTGMRFVLVALMALSLHALALSYEPVSQTVSGALIPGDFIKIFPTQNASIKVSYVDAVGYLRTILERRPEGPIIIEIPWGREMIVEAKDGEREPLRIPISPEVKVIVAEAPWSTEREGAIRKVLVLVRTNIEGEAKIVIRDVTRDVLLAERTIELRDREVHEFYIKIPDNPSLLVFKKLSELRKIRVEIVTPTDTYAENNYDDFHLTVKSPEYWRIPWGLGLLLGGVILLSLLSALSRRVFD